MMKSAKRVHPTAEAVLRLLPVAMAAMAAALTAEDREVLAYFLAATCHVEERRRCWRRGRHRPLFCCGCFDCYTSFWLRWDTSPDRELIDQAIEAFEETIACHEPRRHRRRGKVARQERTKEAKSEPPAAAVTAPPADVERIKTRVWPDVTVFFNSRIWNLWSPGV
ncbi:uncharacterized protein LOC144711350 [Wolffia australiana]